jgi:hypothetical protein
MEVNNGSRGEQSDPQASTGRWDCPKDPMSGPNVFILTWCGYPERIHGSTLVFNSLRVGFPSARVQVVDNASHPLVRPTIEKLALGCQAEFRDVKSPVSHPAFLDWALRTHVDEPAVFVDPDITFWRDVQSWQIEGLMAGRLIPAFECPYTGCLTQPRLHTSFLWVPSPRRLLEEIAVIRAARPEFDPFGQRMFPLDGRWIRFDTASAAYVAMPGRMQAFGSQELDAYDHLFAGSNLNLVGEKLDEESLRIMREADEHARTNGAVPRGIWRQQQEWFKSRKPLDVPPSRGREA